MMKKYFFVAASAALVLSSCSNEIEQMSDLSADKGPKEIAFSTYMPGMTRAVEATLDSLQKYGFYLYAITPDPGTDGDTVTYVNELYKTSYKYVKPNWKPADGLTHIWPTSKVSFYAISYPDSVSTSDSRFECTSFYDVAVTIPVVNGEQDIMAAKATNLTYDGTTEKVSLSFNHILAEVAVKVKGAKEDEAYAYKVYGVKVSAPGSSSYDYNTGHTGFGGYTEYTIAPQNMTQGAFILGPETDGGVEVTYSVVDCNGTSYTQIGDPKMVVPTDSCVIQIGYEIYYNGERINQEEKAEVAVAVKGGYRNNIQITLKPGNLPISVDPQVTEWASRDTTAVL